MNQSKRTLLIIAGAFIGLSICTILYVFLSKPMMDKYLEVQDWPSVQGTISHSNVDCWEEEKIVDDRYLTETRCSASVEYEYTINGRTFISSYIRPNSGIKTTYDRNTAQKIAAKYPVGAKVEVFYNPDELSNAFLEKEMKFGVFLLYLLPFILGLVIIIVIVVNSKRAYPFNLFQRIGNDRKDEN